MIPRSLLVLALPWWKSMSPLVAADAPNSGVIHLPLRRRLPSEPRNRSISRWLLAEASETVPLFPGLGTHYVDIYVGSPPQRQSVIVDTGSPLTAFTCSPGCDEETCGKHTDPFYDLTRSQSSRRLSCAECRTQCVNGKCEISQRYSEGSAWSAFLVRDKLYIGGDKPKGPPSGGEQLAIDFTFGCQTKLTGLFIPQRENGIMGLSNGEENILKQLKKAGKIEHAIFALCFAPEGGTMTLGGVMDHFHSVPLSYVPMSTSRNGWYLVQVHGITMGTNVVASQSAYALLDSGTTDTYLLRSSGPAFQELFQKSTGLPYTPGETYTLTPYELMLLPAILFKLSDTLVLEMTPDKYMEVQGRDAYVPRIYFSEKTMPILGANLLSGYDVVFDLDRQRVGIARSRCGYDTEETRAKCNCPAGTAGKQVCGADGLTYQSKCLAECYGTQPLWEGACPTRVPARCSAALFSDAKGCRDLARQLFTTSNNTLLTASSLCTNPCWESAAAACESMHYDEMRGAAQHNRLGVSEDFCAVSESGAYCRDLYTQKGAGGATWDCAALQSTGCCFHHISSLLPEAERTKLLEGSTCMPKTSRRCRLVPEHMHPLKLRAPRIVGGVSSLLRFTSVDVFLLLLVTAFLFFFLAPSRLRELPRQAWAKLTRKRYELVTSVGSPRRRSSTVELESVHLRDDFDPPR